MNVTQVSTPTDMGLIITLLLQVPLGIGGFSVQPISSTSDENKMVDEILPFYCNSRGLTS